MDAHRPRTALVTGASGFVGSRLAAHLLNRGWQVHLVLRPQSSMAALESIRERVTLHTLDGTTEQLVSLLGTIQPDVVFHLASLFLASHQPKDILPLVQSNVAFGGQLLEAMHVNKLTRLINTGTFAQHFENASYSPVTLYAATKQAFEALIRFYTDAGTLRCITLKLFDTYGPGDTRAKLLGLIMKALRSQETLAMSPGGQKMDFIYIDDVCRAYEMAADRLLAGAAEPFESYAVSGLHPVTLRDLVAAIEGITGTAAPIQFGGRPYRPREVMVPWNTGTLLPGWLPQMVLNEGLRRCVTTAGGQT